MRESICCAFVLSVTVSAFSRLNLLDKYRVEDMPLCNFSAPSTTVRLSASSPHAVSFSELFVPFFLKHLLHVDQWWSSGYPYSSHNTQRHTCSIVWSTGPIGVHSPKGLVGKPLSGVNDLFGVIMYSLW